MSAQPLSIEDVLVKKHAEEAAKLAPPIAQGAERLFRFHPTQRVAPLLRR
jgi:hypothetical protein